MEVTIRQVRPGESVEFFREIAKLHREVIDTGFLSTLGDSFLITLYQTLAASPYAFLLVAESDGLPVGFICGSMDTGQVYKDFMRRAGLRVLPKLLPKFLSLRRIQRIVETLLYPGRNRGSDVPEAEILNFCVSTRLQKQGIGRRLFEALATEFARREVPRIKIVTGAVQTKAQGFYESVGARKHASLQVHKDAESLMYLYDIAPLEESSLAEQARQS